MSDSLTNRLGKLAKLFFKLGVIGFGGPAAHIAMMEDEVVNRRKWLTREHFLDLVGATNLIPGPNSTEMAIHVGYIYAGWWGLLVGGVCFIFPAVVLTAGFAWVYVTLGTLPQVTPFLYGIKPAVLAIIFAALWRLGKTAVKSWKLLLIAVAVAMGVFWGLNEIVALLLGGLMGMICLRLRIGTFVGSMIFPLPLVSNIQKLNSSSLPLVTNVSLWQLGLFFLKIGSVLYGSGYVLVAFLQAGLVDDLGWLTQQQLLDAIAIGQFTPGPVLSTATFIGYVISGMPGALIATLGIFAPSFLFVATLNPLIPRLRASKWTSAFLDAVNVSAVALMAVVSVRLFLNIVIIPVTRSIDWVAVLIALVAIFLTIRWRLNPAFLVMGGAVIGWGWKMLDFQF
ncbi:MAG: chromate efflux transporter [Nostocaceae cyanobacterium]|nr:chromate efflux transporter [Nostocaceae cyanobacterium]